MVMARTVTRSASIALVALIGAALMAVLPTSSAAAADSDLGWVRLKAASGKTDAPVIALTEAACPAGAKAVVVRLGGPGVTDKVGNLVGVTQVKAFDETVSGQIWIPLQFVFDQWFQINSVTPKAGAQYSITVTCRDLLRASKTFGAFAGAVIFDGKGGYKAVGESAKPFDTELKPLDPALGGGAPSPGVSQSSGATADPSTSPDDSSVDPTADPNASGTTGAGQGDGAGQPVAASASSPRVPADNTARNVILGGSLLLLAGIALMSLLGRVRARRQPSSGSHSSGADAPRRDTVDSL
jgi:hypothetical protein